MKKLAEFAQYEPPSMGGEGRWADVLFGRAVYPCKATQRIDASPQAACDHFK